MPRDVSALELALNERPRHMTRTRWLYQELLLAILERRLPPGSRLPSTRDLANEYDISRGTIVTAFEQLQAEGYLISRVGSGTRVNERLPDPVRTQRLQKRAKKLPGSLSDGGDPRSARPFRAYEPAVSEFPIRTWARVAGRRLRSASTRLLAGGDPRGYPPLREAIAAYLGLSRGVRCSPDQVVIVTGTQQGLDLVARVTIKSGDAVWMEDPGYFGATRAFRNAAARIIPVPTDDAGLSIVTARRLCNRAKAVYLTPAHQFPLGMTMTLERRLAILAWAREVGAFVIEDDYDSEFRFEGLPVPAMQGLDRGGSVIYLGSFNKVMFPSLRVGYLVLPPELVESFLSFRLSVDLHASGVDQAVLCDFIVEGHFGRHIRRMRQLYSHRLGTLLDAGRKYFNGLLDLLPIRAGLCTAGLLKNGMTSRTAEAAASAHDIETMALSRFALKRSDVHGLLLGFASFDESEIRRGVVKLAGALEREAPKSHA